MLLNASVKSKLMKRGSEKKLATLLGNIEGKELMADVRDFVGKLELNAERPEDFFLLRGLWNVIRGESHGGGGRIVMYDRDGNKVEDYLSVVSEKCVCKSKKTHSMVCVERWRADNPGPVISTKEKKAKKIAKA